MTVTIRAVASGCLSPEGVGVMLVSVASGEGPWIGGECERL